MFDLTLQKKNIWKCASIYIYEKVPTTPSQKKFGYISNQIRKGTTQKIEYENTKLSYREGKLAVVIR